MNHYEVLGVERRASAAEIRAAFRRLARAHHPDTSRSGSPDLLVPINDAWRVLGDPALRRAYDRSLDAPDVHAVAGDSTSAPMPESAPPSSFPWRFLIGLAVIGIAIAVLGVFTYEPPKPGPPDNVLDKGSCVVIEENGDATEVNCGGDHDGVVESIIGADETCPAALQPHPDRLGLGKVACVRFNV